VLGLHAEGLPYRLIARNLGLSKKLCSQAPILTVALHRAALAGIPALCPLGYRKLP